MRRHRLLLGLLLAGAFALRVWLAAGGGQNYWPDESMRYGDAMTVAHHLKSGEVAAAGRELLSHPDHLLFRWQALPPALLDVWLGDSPFRAACYFAGFSVLVIWLVWALARRAGAAEGEALMAAALAACANSLFFYSRHFFPYDGALALVLLGLWTGLGGGQAWRAVAAGSLVGAGFLNYNGYWLVGGVALAVMLPRPGEGRGRLLLRAAGAGAGLLGAVGAAVLLARLAGADLLAGWRATSGTITQGDFGQGWWVILDYFWSAEGPLALAWAAAVAGAAWIGWRTRDVGLLRWLAAVILLLAGLVALSDVVHKFVVYGRLARVLTPFLCLLLARVLTLASDRPAWLQPALLVAAAGCAAWNFAGPLRQVFPAEFLQQAKAEAKRRQARQPGAYATIRAEHLWGADLQTPLPPHQEIMRARHPLEFRPYQYEGFSREQRGEFDRFDISMRLIRVLVDSSGLSLAGDPLFGAHLGPLRLRVKFPLRALGRSEPLITTGSTQRGDFLFVRYEDSARVRFGFDHWGSGGMITEPIPVDYNQEHELVISLGALMPAEEAECYRAQPWTGRLRRLVFVALDGQPVLSLWSDFYPTEPGDVSIGSNFIGGSSAMLGFTGQLGRVERMPLAELARHLPFARLTAGTGRGTEWEGAPGPWLMRLRLPPVGDRAAEPLYSVRGEGLVEALLLERLDERTARVRFERDGAVLWSEPFAVDPSRQQEFLFSSGSLYPAMTAALFQEQPERRPLRSLVYVECNGRVVLLRNLAEPAGRVQEAALGALVDAGMSGRPHFSGLVETMEPADPAKILRNATQLAAKVGSRGPAWAGYPGPVRFRVRLPQQFPADGIGEPLAVGGVTGAGDFLVLFLKPDGTARIGVDHWGKAAPPLSEAFPVAPGQTIEITASAGFLWPPAGSPLYASQPELAAWAERLVILVDGRKVLESSAPSHRSVAENLTVGVNFIGGSTARASLLGVIEGVELADLPALERAVRP